MDIPRTHTSPELDQLLAPLEVPAGSVVLADFDHTLCHAYVFDARSNDHIPQIDAGTIEAADQKHVIVATGRRAESAALLHVWDDGLVPINRPIISENGGVMVQRTEAGVEYTDLVPEFVPHYLQDVKKVLETDVVSPDARKELVVKVGRTMLITRLQDAQGKTTPVDQEWLAEQVANALPDQELKVVDNRVSIGVQCQGISKVSAFHHYLRMAGISRDEIFVVGMGDGENDSEIFDEADLRIGFSPVVEHLVDISVPGTPEAINAVLRKIQT